MTIGLLHPGEMGAALGRALRGGAQTVVWASAGRFTGVYSVPYGELWYEYSLRRLQENPALAGTMAKATVARVLGRS